MDTEVKEEVLQVSEPSPTIDYTEILNDVILKLSDLTLLLTYLLGLGVIIIALLLINLFFVGKGDK